MHFSIPETQELYEDPKLKKKPYTSYNIHVNGVYHCSVRYSQLYKFQEELCQHFGPVITEKFPPKQFLSLSEQQVDERRQQLETYLQKASQEPRVANSPLFNNFLLKAQKEVQLFCEEVEIDVYLVNGKSRTIKALSTDQTDDVLELACKEIGIPEEFTYYFGLFMVEDIDNGSYRFIRKVQDFESPYISLERSQNKKLRIQLRKAFWDPKIEAALTDKTVINMLYIEAQSNVKNGQLIINAQNKKELAALKGKKKEYLELCRELKNYGHLIVENCTADFPNDYTHCTVTVGSNALTIRDTRSRREYTFAVTRMRCWKISGSFVDGLELSFHYLKSKSELIWIRVWSESAIFLSMCLQSVVDELLRLRDGARIRRPEDRPKLPKPKPKARPADIKIEPPKSQLAEKQKTAAEERRKLLETQQAESEADPSRPASIIASRPSSIASRPSSMVSQSDDDIKPLPQSTSVSKIAPQASSVVPTDGNGKQSTLGKLFRKSSSSAAPKPKMTAGFNAAFDEEYEDNNVVFGGIGDDDL